MDKSREEGLCRNERTRWQKSTKVLGEPVFPTLKQLVRIWTLANLQNSMCARSSNFQNSYQTSFSNLSPQISER